MYCDKCGKEIKDDVKFCRYCGALMEAQSSNHPEGGHRKAKMSEAEAYDAKRKMFGIVAIIVFAVLLVIALSVIYINTDEKKILGD